jgi:hypothetical protein
MPAIVPTMSSAATDSGAEVFAPRAEVLEHQSDDDREEHDERSGQHHRLERADR